MPRNKKIPRIVPNHMDPLWVADADGSSLCLPAADPVNLSFYRQRVEIPMGVRAAHVMFGPPVFQLSIYARHGGAQWLSEFIATFGLIAVLCAYVGPTWLISNSLHNCPNSI